MNDMVYLGVFGGCVLATFGLAWLCEKLARPAAGAKGDRK